jgi:drug/metabolite transporter (DMT)-like permease
MLPPDRWEPPTGRHGPARMMPAQQRALAVASLATIYVVWGSTYLAIKIGVGGIPPFLLGASRFAVAGGLLYAWTTWRRPAPPRERKREWGAAAVAGGLLLVGGTGAVTWAEQYIDTGLAALLAATVPLWMAILDRVRHGRRLVPAAIAGLLLGFAGVAALVSPAGVEAAQRGAALVVLGGALSWAVGSLYARGAPLPADPLRSTAMQMLAASGIFAVLAVATREPARLDLSALGWEPFFALSYLVLVGSIVAFSAYTWLLRNVAAATVSTYAYVNPVVALLLGWAVLGERLTATTLIASGVIVAAVGLIVGGSTVSRLAQARAAAAPPPPARAPAEAST